MQKASAIVTDEGGITSHAAIVSREMGIPAVVGTEEATIKLKEGEVITVNGFTGKVYKGKVSEKVEKEVLPVTAQTKTKIKVIIDLPSFAKRASRTELREVGLLRIEGIIAESGKHPNYFLEQNKIQEYEELIFKGVKEISEYFDELWVRTSDIRSDEFQNLEGASKEIEANPMLGFHGIRYGLKNPKILKAELKALKKISQQGKGIGLLLPQIISVEEVKKVKEFLKEINFVDVKVGVMIETPASVQIIEELCEEGIDFVSFGTNDLTQYTLAIDRGNEEVQEIYDEMNPSILKQLEYVLRIAKANNVETSICGQAGSKKEMVKFLVEREIDSISVNPDAAKEISNYVAELESEDSNDVELKIPETELIPIEELQENEEIQSEERQEERNI
jgi:pyruvate,water dikinase